MTNELRCPCCDQPMPPKSVKTIKSSINAFLNTLTNPPMAWPYFKAAARLELEPLNLMQFLHEAGGVQDMRDPFTCRIPVPQWDCVLVVQGCYYKVEVCYFS